MKHGAVSITAREHAELVEVSYSQTLGADEVMGRTVCTLISPGTELAWNYKGNSFPSFPGYAAVFEAEEIGSEVKNVTTGGLYFCMGPHRSFQKTNAMDVFPVPPGLSPQEAVLARLMGVSMTTLATTAARPGDRVLVTGAGPVGYMAAQIFAISGYDVMVAEPDETRRRNIVQSGIKKVFSDIPHNDPDIAGTVALVAECSGYEQPAIDGCKVVRKRGEVVLIGVPWLRHSDSSAHELLSLVFHKYVILRSGWEWEFSKYATDQTPHSLNTGFATALRWLAEGRVKTDGLIKQFSPDDCQSVYNNLLHGKSEGLFAIFDWAHNL